MALGFKKGFFGYNCEEVTEYITRLTAENNQAVSALKEKINAQTEKTKQAENEIEQLNGKIAEIEESLQFYKSKYDEVKKLSDNIGKLYLVAQTNAKSIMDSANSAHASSKAEIDKNIEILSSTEDSLGSLEEKIMTLSNEFSQSVAQLKQELADLKIMATSAEMSYRKSNENFKVAYNEIV